MASDWRPASWLSSPENCPGPWVVMGVSRPRPSRPIASMEPLSTSQDGASAPRHRTRSRPRRSRGVVRCEAFRCLDLGLIQNREDLLSARLGDTHGNSPCLPALLLARFEAHLAASAPQPCHVAERLALVVVAKGQLAVRMHVGVNARHSCRSSRPHQDVVDLDLGDLVALLIELFGYLHVGEPDGREWI